MPTVGKGALRKDAGFSGSQIVGLESRGLYNQDF